MTSEHIDLGADLRHGDWGAIDDIGTARIVARSTSEAPIFIGIVRHADVERFLSASAHDELTDVSFDPFRATYAVRRAGDGPPCRQSNRSGSPPFPAVAARA